MNKISLILWFGTYKIVWLCCVLGGGVYGYPFTAGLPIVVWTLLWIAQADDKGVFYTSLVALLYGTIADGLLVAFDVMNFASSAQTKTPSPIWMMALWFGFGSIYKTSLGFLKQRVILLSIIGAIGGPMAYLGGANMNAVEIASSKTLFMLFIGLEWAVALPLLMWSTHRFSSPKRKPDVQSTNSVQPLQE